MNKWLIIFILLSLFTCRNKNDRLHPGAPAPGFSAQTPAGKMISLEQYRGKYILIHFWADWCSDCRAEFEKLENAYRSLKKENIEIIAVNAGQTKEHVLEFVEYYNLTFPMIMDEKKEITELYKIHSLPTNYFIKPDLTISKITIGWVSENQILEQINKMRNDP